VSSSGDCRIIPGGFFRNTTGGGGASTQLNLDDLGDVAVTTPANNQLLYYNSGSSLWVNASASTIGLATLTGSETLTNKILTSPTITSPTISNLYLSDGLILVEGTTNDTNEMSLVVGTLTADRTITLPDTSGTVITTGNLTSITSTGTISSGTWNATAIDYSKLSLSNSIVNDDISSSAAVAYSKLNLTGAILNADLAGSIANNKLTNSSVTVNGSSISLGESATITATATNALTIGTGLSGSSYNGSTGVTIAIDSTVATLTGNQTLTNKTLTSPTINSPTISNLYLSDGLILVEGTTNDSNEMSLVVGMLTADRTITFPNATGTLITSGDTATVTNTMLAGSIANDKLANSSITVNGSSISLGGSATVTATATNALTLGTGLTGTSYNGSTGVTAAVDTSTIATRAYVDTVAQGLHIHATAKTATTATLATLTGTTVSYAGGAITWTGGNAANGASFNDGTTLTANTTEASADRILVKNEGGVGGLGASKNGIYYVYGARELRRTSDGDAASDWLGGDFCFIVSGTIYADTGWVQTEAITTLDTDSIIWQQFSGAGVFTADETTLTLSGSQFSIKSTYVGQTSITTLGTIATGTWNATAIGETRGGTNQTTYATGDLLYASATNTLSKLAKPASLTSFLQMTSAGVPSWTSTIPTTNGGTGLTSFTSGGLVYASSTSALTTGTVFDIDSTANAYRINIASGATPKTSQEFKVIETAFNSSAAIGVYTDVSDNPPGSLGQAYVNLASTAGTDCEILLSSGTGSVTFAGGTTPLSLTTTPSLFGSVVGVLYCFDNATNPYILFGDDGTNFGTSIKITDTSATMVVTATTLKINTSTPASGKVLTCSDSNGTCTWETATSGGSAPDFMIFAMGII
jgi:hypothetical protein